MNITRKPQFDKRLRLAPRTIRNALADRLELFVVDPHHPLLHNHSLQGERQGFYSINITGDWRCIYKKVDSDTIQLFELDTHHHLYGT